MYNYHDAICADICAYIDEEITLTDYEDRDELESHLNDTLWTVDDVTGNASGSYYCNAYKAEEALCHNWDLLAEAMQEFCYDCNAIEKGPEWADVTIRCYLLGQCISAVLDEMGDELREAFESRVDEDDKDNAPMTILKRYELDGYKNTIHTHYVAIRGSGEEALAFARELMQEHDLDCIQVRDSSGNLIYEL